MLANFKSLAHSRLSQDQTEVHLVAAFQRALSEVIQSDVHLPPPSRTVMTT